MFQLAIATKITLTEYRVVHCTDYLSFFCYITWIFAGLPEPEPEYSESSYNLRHIYYFKKKNCHLVSFTNIHMISSLLFPTSISLFLCYLNQVHLCHTPFRSTYSLPDCVKICSLAKKAWQCPWACSFCELASANWLKQLFLIFGLPCYQPASYM